jgi:beta-glucuronidase
MITEMITRDKNHPSVIAWSLANEPALKGEASFNYFRYFKLIYFNFFYSDLYLLAHSLDSTRPITAVFGYLSNKEILNIFDIICLNRYYG